MVNRQQLNIGFLDFWISRVRKSCTAAGTLKDILEISQISEEEEKEG
jgi:hypothetical protein